MITMAKEYGVEELLAILPLYLKSKVCYQLYRDAIETVKIL